LSTMCIQDVFTPLLIFYDNLELRIHIGNGMESTPTPLAMC
jgi:hypothetical protein